MDPTNHSNHLNHMGHPGQLNQPDRSGDDRAMRALTENLSGLGLLGGGANVIMQLSMLPIGHGVAKSRVDSGRVDKHPIKRLRTTASYLVIALFGSEAERKAIRREINKVHSQVRAGVEDEVQYNAFDTDLQLWVAACLYKGHEDITRLLGQTNNDPNWLDDIYWYCRRLATTLQVPESDWPVDRAAFETYWDRCLESIDMDDLTRSYLWGIAEHRVFLAPMARLGRPFAGLANVLVAIQRPFSLLLTGGFLPPEFRDLLGMTWTDNHQARFDRLFRVLAFTNRVLPGPIRRFPLNLYLYDARRRLAAGRRVV